MKPKICPICRKKIIASWESTCSICWKKLEEHDRCELCHGNKNLPFLENQTCPLCYGTGKTGNWCNNIIIFNNVREICRKAGFDPIQRMPF